MLKDEVLLPAPALVPDPEPVPDPALDVDPRLEPKPPMFGLVGALQNVAVIPAGRQCRYRGVASYLSGHLHPAPVVLIAPRLAK
jgi:hypothetical protein